MSTATQTGLRALRVQMLSRHHSTLCEAARSESMSPAEFAATVLGDYARAVANYWERFAAEMATATDVPDDDQLDGAIARLVALADLGDHINRISHLRALHVEDVCKRIKDLNQIRRARLSRET